MQSVNYIFFFFLLKDTQLLFAKLSSTQWIQFSFTQKLGWLVQNEGFATEYVRERWTRRSERQLSSQDFRF